jgi:hypothetical protein
MAPEIMRVALLLVTEFGGKAEGKEKGRIYYELH